MHGYGRSRIGTFTKTGNAYKAIGTDERSNDTRAAADWRGHDLLAHLPHSHTDKIIIANGRGNFTG